VKPLPFLNRKRELAHLQRAVDRRTTSLICIYGRRRLGKSRLVRELVASREAVYFVGDDRDGPVQRAAVAREIERMLPRFASVVYPGWGELLDRFWAEAPEGAILALDEFPALVTASPELPSLLQKKIDQPGRRSRKVILCGSSQRMMQGLVLEPATPLYGRAEVILKLEPLAPFWIQKALRPKTAVQAVEHYAVWGGVPRYWELARAHPSLWQGLASLVLDPMGVLHGEPHRLLLDDMSEVARAASILSVIGVGAHRVSEIAGRVEVPATSLSRPIQRLLELGLIRRDVPFGSSPKDSKRSLYRIADPLLAFYYRFVEPNRSRLASGQVRETLAEIRSQWPIYLGTRWEQMVRERVGGQRLLGTSWKPASRFWGTGASGATIEIDVVAESVSDPNRVLVGEAKLAVSKSQLAAIFDKLERTARDCPALAGRSLVFSVWVLRREEHLRDRRVLGAADVLWSD
jgi:AAA+ ATPase superfamily predicted ATPase